MLEPSVTVGVAVVSTAQQRRKEKKILSVSHAVVSFSVETRVESGGIISMAAAPIVFCLIFCATCSFSIE